jgi:Xaa-Pro aminopeptidase
MFQTFTASSTPEQGPNRLKSLRQEIENAGLSGFLIPRADAHQGEYVAPCDERLGWLTGFTGSAGFCAVLPDIAGVFIDGRYRVQIKSQVSLDVFTPINWPEIKLPQWLIENSSPKTLIGFDPWLHTVDDVKTLHEHLHPAGLELVPCANLVDAIWTDRPAQPDEKITTYPVELAGETSASKRASIASQLKQAGQDAHVITQPDALAWLLNIRGSDIARIPVPRCFAILKNDGHVHLFADPAKTADLVTDPTITQHAPDALTNVLDSLKGSVLIDPKTCAQAIAEALQNPVYGPNPIALPKARKNQTEIAGTREAHLRDGAAVVEFLCWLDDQKPAELTEISAVKALENARRATNLLCDISFETISGLGPNGAIVHYRVSENTNRVATDGDLLLIDSGAQYLDGTTDITRTIPIGAPTAEQKRCFTLVLQGMIAVSGARFPRGLTGRDIDPLARAPLWREGLDFDHGTGHGVGHYLSVHEGPQRISRVSNVPLEPGMILSNEPGYYREGAFGIRIENLIVVQDAPPIQGGDARDMLSFETLTYAPIDRRLIDITRLAPHDIDWLNTYHADVLDKLTTRLTAKSRNWLACACAPL